MIEVINEVEISASPGQVWNALVDFAGYRNWNPYVAIRGDAGSGSEFEWSLGSTLLKRRIWTRVLVREFDEPNVLEWSFGSRRIFAVTERFSLHATQRGTRLKHKASCGGVFMMMLGSGLMRKRVETIVTAVDKGLCRYFERKGGPSKDPLGPFDKLHPPRRKPTRPARKRRR